MEPQETPVILLVGGRGSRLGSVTELPKPLIEVAGRPFLCYVLGSLHRQGFRRIYCLTGYHAGLFEKRLDGALREASLPDLEIHYMVEKTPLGTGGALRTILPFLDRYGLLLNGDSYCSVEYRDLLDLAGGGGASFALTAVRVRDAGDYGGLELDAAGCVTRFREKGLTGSAWVNAGVYAVHRRFVERAIPEGVSSLEQEILPAWLKTERVPTLRVDGFFHDIGTPERLAEARALFPPPDLL